MTMDTALFRRRLDSRKLTEFGFGGISAICFLGFVGLYVAYGAFAFLRLGDHIPIGDRAIMVLAPSTIAISFLVAPAVFAASAIRFDLLTAGNLAGRRVYWGQLVLASFCAYLLWAVGPLAVRSMLPVTIDPPPESFMPFREALADLRLLSPVSCALFVMVSGVAGALIGRISAKSHWNGARAGQWFACLGLIVAFWALSHITSYRILQDGIPAIWIVLAPLSLPVAFTVALAWRELGPPTEWVSLGRQLGISDPKDPDVLDAIVFAAGKEPGETVVEDWAAGRLGEQHSAMIARRIRSLVGSRATLSQSQIAEIVATLSKREESTHESGIYWSAKRARSLGDFCSAWTCLTTGSLVVASLGGLTTNVGAALLSGLVGSIGVVLMFRVTARGTAAGSVPV